MNPYQYNVLRSYLPYQEQFSPSRQQTQYLTAINQRLRIIETRLNIHPVHHKQDS